MGTIKHVQHVRSSVIENSKPKLPTASQLEYGEIAINYAKGYETISIKNSTETGITTFSSDEYYTEKKLGSGFTGENSGRTVTDFTYDKDTIDEKIAESGTFDPSLYFKKNEFVNSLSVAFSRELSGSTEVIFADVNTVNDITSETSGSSLPISTSYIAKSHKTISASLNDLEDKKLDASAYTPTDLSNYYTKNETSGKSEIQSALGLKQDTLVSGVSIKTINNTSLLGSGNIVIEGGGGDVMLETTYSQLLSDKNNGNLSIGTMYRITDYVTTTTQAGTMSANHQFDIVVIATDVDKINENALAVQHEGESYFSDSSLNSWVIKYSLENDKTRFAWADAENGKGVIYYMKDEFGNEAPYDFKNIQFKRYKITNIVGGAQVINGTVDDLRVAFLDSYALWGSSEYSDYNVNFSSSTSDTKYCYTFNFTVDGEDRDASCNLSTGISECYDNVIKSYVNERGKFELNNIVIFGNITYNNTFESNCKTISAKDGFIGNTIGNDAKELLFGDDCANNTFGSNFQTISIAKVFCRNAFGDYVTRMSFGNEFKSNDVGSDVRVCSFGSGCTNNVINGGFENNHIGLDSKNCVYGSGFKSNRLGNECYGNIFGNNCSGNTLGNKCYGNIFGNGCNDNQLTAENCYFNKFGNNCDGNAFTGKCYGNSFGNECSNNTFGENCNRNTFNNRCSNNIFLSTCRYNTFDNNCQNNELGGECYNNTFGTECSGNVLNGNSTYNVFGHACKDNEFVSNGCYNIFGNECNENTFGNACMSNVFGNACCANNLGDICSFNSFGNNSSTNELGSGCDGNTLGTGCIDNTFGNDCSNNSFGNLLHNSSFGDECSNNSLGNYCSVLTFGNKCALNEAGNSFDSSIFESGCSSNVVESSIRSIHLMSDCKSNHFSSSCSDISLSASSIGNYFEAKCTNINFKKPFTCHCTVKGENAFVDLTSESEPNSLDKLQYIEIGNGFHGSASNVITITHNALGSEFKTTYQKANTQIINM